MGGHAWRTRVTSWQELVVGARRTRCTPFRPADNPLVWVDLSIEVTNTIWSNDAVVFT